MKTILHSIALQPDLCKGCTHCVRRCPTEAIRVKNGKAVIRTELCIDCGECIRICPYQAKKSIYDKLDKFKNYKFKIALPSPTLFGQFDKLEDIDYVVSGLYRCGFDEVFEVAKAAELVSEYTRLYLHQEGIKRPVISSSCPVITRLIAVRFPSLIHNILPIFAPMELAARTAKAEALKKHPELHEEDICALFISPCPAKVSYVKNPIGVEKSAVDGVLAVRDIYFALADEMGKIDNPTKASESGLIGISWAGTGGESAALLNERYLAADGIENVIRVLDEIEKENFRGLEFVELNACPGGCVGGALNVENAYVAKARLQNLRRYLPVSLNRLPTGTGQIPTEVMWEKEVTYRPVSRLDADREEAFKKMAQIQEIREKLCDLDCGSCGAPNCQALAEDIAKGEAELDDCVIYMREKYKRLAEEEW